MRWLKSLILALVIAGSGSVAAMAADSDPAARKIENFYAGLVDTMKRGPQLGMRGRFQALTPVVDATFDFPDMIKFIVGTSWSTMSDDDHKALTTAFRRMTIANYAGNFDSFSGERFVVEPGVQIKGTDKFVQSTLTPKGEAPIPFIYRMRDTGGDWKVIDIYLNGYVSELATRRSDFAATLTGGGAKALEQKLNALTENLLAGAKPASQ